MPSISVSGNVTGVDIPGNAQYGVIDVDLRQSPAAGGSIQVQAQTISGFVNGPVTVTISQ